MIRIPNIFHTLCLLMLWSSAYGTPPTIHHVPVAACRQCHEEIFQQWAGSMHALSSAVKDPIHGAFYRTLVGDPTKEDVRTNDGKLPMCLKCHAPIAALDQQTKLDAAPAYADGVGCVTCHSFSAFKGNNTPEGKPLYGSDAYEMDATSLHGPSGITYTQEQTAPGASWPATTHHPQPIAGNQAELFRSNAICMGCHEKRSNAQGVALCRTGDEYRADHNFVTCQSCHMPVTTIPRIKDGKVVPGEFLTIADHTMAGGHSPRMLNRGLTMEMNLEKEQALIKVALTLRNRLPHAYPTGAPFRNVFIKLAAYDKDGKELWKNYKEHPIKDDPKSALWYALGNDAGQPVMAHLATRVLSDTRLQPNETRVLEYEIPVLPTIAIVRAEVLYDLLLPPIKAQVKGKIPEPLLKPTVAAAAEMRF